MAKDRIESKYVTVAPGVELHILEKGEGKPLVFIPGLTFSGEIFKNQLEYFSSEYRVIAIDPRGQGYSAKTVDGNDYLTHAPSRKAQGERISVVPPEFPRMRTLELCNGSTRRGLLTFSSAAQRRP